ncbi:IPT/TIG domain-containing protein [Dermacoccaceae bacterium W4C1]
MPITVKTGSTYPSRTVRVQRAAAGSTAWSTIATLSTAASGAATVTLPVAAVGKWHYRLMVIPTINAAGFTTSTRAVTGVTGVSTTVTGWSTSPLTGMASSALRLQLIVKAGSSASVRSVAVQKTSVGGSVWSAVSTTQTASNGAVTVTLPVPSSGSVSYRLVVSPSATAAGFTSQGRVVAVTPPPTVTKVTPAVGTAAGGMPVTVTGTNLTGASRVTFGSVPGAAVKVQSSTSLTVSVPPSAATGPVEVRVTTPAGVSAATAGARFTYTQAASWKPGTVITNKSGGMLSLRCTSPTSCVSATSTGNVLTGSGSVWTASKFVHPVISLREAACSSATFCVGIDTDGKARTFSEGTWSGPVTPLDDSLRLANVWCAPTRFCVVTDGAKLSTFDGSQWSTPTTTNVARITAAACTSKSFCVAGGSDGTVSMFDGSSWSPFDLLEPERNSQVASVSCPQVGQCVAYTEDDRAYTLSDGAWSAPVRAGGLGWAPILDCASVTSCLAVDFQGNYSVLRDGDWSDSAPSGMSSPVAMSCAGRDSCAAVDGVDAITWDGAGWSTSRVIKEGALEDVACPSESFCMAVANRDTYMTYDGKAWSAPKALPDGLNPHLVDCVSSTFCVATGGDHVTGLATTFDGNRWSAGVPVGEVTSLSCVSPTFCAAASDRGVLIFNGSTWSATPNPGQFRMRYLSCLSSAFCMGVNYNGGIQKFNGSVWERGNNPMWTTSDVALLETPYHLSCVSTTFCAVVTNKKIWTYDGASWTPTTGSGERISCATPNFCATTGYSMQAMTFNGTRWSPLQKLTIPDETEATAISCATQNFCVAISSGSALVYRP